VAHRRDAVPVRVPAHGHGDVAPAAARDPAERRFDIAAADVVVRRAGVLESEVDAAQRVGSRAVDIARRGGFHPVIITEDAVEAGATFCSALDFCSVDRVADQLGEFAKLHAYAWEQPHFVAAWAPEKEREAEHSAALARRVSLELQDVSLDAALKALTNRAGLRITYSQAILPKSKRVTIKAGDIAVVTALTEMLFRSGLDVVVDQDGTLALVPCKHLRPRAEIQDSGTIMGTVTDEGTRSPLVGASIALAGTRLSTITDNEGKYRLEGIETGMNNLFQDEEKD